MVKYSGKYSNLLYTYRLVVALTGIGKKSNDYSFKGKYWKNTSKHESSIHN